MASSSSAIQRAEFDRQGSHLMYRKIKGLLWADILMNKGYLEGKYLDWPVCLTECLPIPDYL